MYSSRTFESDVRPDWCPGCGNFAVLAALKDALTAMKLEAHNVVVVSGIGCSSNLPGYMRAYGFHGLHGRPIPVAVGIKSANPRLTVIVAAGDGDEYGIGFNHVVNAARRNDDVKLIVMNNEIYGLTAGQSSPTSRLGQRTKTTPDGSVVYPLKPLSTLLGAGATFLARGFSGDPKHLSMLIREAVGHRGFALVDTISPCVTWHNIYDEVREKVYRLEDGLYKPDDEIKAYETISRASDLPIGIFYRTEAKPTFQEMLATTNGGRWAVDGVRRLAQREGEALVQGYA